MVAIVGLVNWWCSGTSSRFALKRNRVWKASSLSYGTRKLERSLSLTSWLSCLPTAKNHPRCHESWGFRSRRAWELIIIIIYIICTLSDITRPSDRQIISKTNTSAIINIMSKCKTRFIWIVVNSIEIDSIPARICHHSLPQVMGRTGMSWRKYFSLRI